MRLTTLFACFVLFISIILMPGCGNKATTDESTTSSDSSEEISDSTTVSDASSEITDTNTSTGDSSDIKSNSTNTTAVTVSGGNSNLIPSTEEGKWGTKEGVSSTKKVPDWMKTISSGKLVSLSASTMDATAYAYQQTVFKALTGQNLEIEQKIVEWNSLRSTLQTMVLSGNAPDIFSIYNGVGTYLRNTGLTRNIKDYINMNDAAWDGMKSYSEDLFYKGELTGVVINQPLITGGFMYNKTLINQAGLDDPWTLFENKTWTITKFIEYVEELTTDENHDGVPEVYGVSMAPACLFKLSLASGEDLVKINNDGSVSNNLRSATFTRFATYAAAITAAGSNDTESWTAAERFIQGKIALCWNNVWDQTSSSDLIAMKKSGKLGWVPCPKDVNASTYYHAAEMSQYFLPKNSANPQGGAAYYYTLRYISLNPSPEQEAKTKDKYINEYGWTEKEYLFQKNMKDYMTATPFNAFHIPDFDFTPLWAVFTKDWSTLVEEVYPSLQSALDAQNN